MDQDQDLLNAIARLSRMTRRHPKGKDALSRMHYHILLAVQEENGIRTTALAERMAIRPASITEVLNRLEKDGYLTRHKDEADLRAKRVFLTEKGLSAISQRTSVHQSDNDRLLACLTPEETKQFLAICNKLCECLEESTSGHGHHHHDREGRHTNNGHPDCSRREEATDEKNNGT